MKIAYLIKKSYKNCDFQKIKKWFIVFFVFGTVMMLLLSYFSYKEMKIKDLEVNKSVAIWNEDKDLLAEQKGIVKKYKCPDTMQCGEALIVVMETYEQAKELIVEYGEELDAVFYNQTDLENISFLENIGFICWIILLVVGLILFILFILVVEDCVKNENKEIYLLRVLGYSKWQIACVVLTRILVEILKIYFLGNVIIFAILLAIGYWRVVFDLRTLLLFNIYELLLIILLFLLYFISFNRIINKCVKRDC